VTLWRDTSGKSLGQGGGKEHACFLGWHKGTGRRRFASIEDVRKGLSVEDRVALTDDFNIATYSALLNSEITFGKKKVSFSSYSKPLSL